MKILPLGALLLAALSVCAGCNSSRPPLAPTVSDVGSAAPATAAPAKAANVTLTSEPAVVSLTGQRVGPLQVGRVASLGKDERTYRLAEETRGAEDGSEHLVTVLRDRDDDNAFAEPLAEAWPSSGPIEGIQVMSSRFRTAEGVGVDSLAQELRRAYGPPERAERNEGESCFDFAKAPGLLFCFLHDDTDFTALEHDRAKVVEIFVTGKPS